MPSAWNMGMAYASPMRSSHWKMTFGLEAIFARARPAGVPHNHA